MNKKDLRQLYLQKRKELPPEVAEALNLKIVDQFSKLSFNAIKVVHLFYPIAGKHEFNSLLIKQYMRNAHPQISLVLPKSNIENNTLTNILWEKDTVLAMNQWGITEPVDGTEIHSALIDMVIVPLLAYDVKGNRIGYGKGFYDRFLAECRPDIFKVGVSYFEPEPEFEDINPFDIPLDICITPKEILRFHAP